ncbi:NAD-dependent epimerase/dehydratase family protein [Rhodocyclus tenuis]|uniref:SDR family oxidoreductase n=1 Tax=Rhodocyclus gracilis TaxID=2929842 RepID=UPI001355C1FC|nr:NAD-dependent epimerase/dehydratase family protein [Rhodocyclus gracilis]
MQNLLIVGCGDVARRALPTLTSRYRVLALLRDPAKCALWRAAGAIPVPGDLDAPRSLARIAGLADLVLHLAPPGDSGVIDLRTRRLISALSHSRSLPRRLVYISTSGVYGDCAGAQIDETREARPQTPRACRRLDAEQQLRAFGRRHQLNVSILRAPGIYAADRLPLERLRAGMPVLLAEDDVFTNHIHADDLAAMAVAALRRALPGRVYNACDDAPTKMADYFDIVADRFGVPRAPRLARDEARQRLSPASWSFMSESRRLVNRRIKKELQIRLRHPRVEDGVLAAWHERNP